MKSLLDLFKKYSIELEYNKLHKGNLIGIRLHAKPNTKPAILFYIWGDDDYEYQISVDDFEPIKQFVRDLEKETKTNFSLDHQLPFKLE